jgi:hypothetical protein
MTSAIEGGPRLSELLVSRAGPGRDCDRRRVLAAGAPRPQLPPLRRRHNRSRAVPERSPGSVLRAQPISGQTPLGSSAASSRSSPHLDTARAFAGSSRATARRRAERSPTHRTDARTSFGRAVLDPSTRQPTWKARANRSLAACPRMQKRVGCRSRAGGRLVLVVAVAQGFGPRGTANERRSQP